MLIAGGLAGGCLGFLPHNFNPARIFMGDSGSMLIGLLLAAAMLAVAAVVERGPLLEQLRALRVQGLSRRTAVALRFAGTTWLAGAGLIAGLVAAVLAEAAARVTAPPFSDGWRVIPPPDALGPLALGLAALAGLAVLAPTVWLTSRGTVR